MRRYLRFYAISFGLACLCGLIVPLARMGLPEAPPQTALTLAGVPMMFTPMISAWLCGRADGLRFRDAVGLGGRPNRYWWVAWVAPVPFVFATVLVSAGLPGVDLAVPVEAFRAAYGDQVPAAALADATAKLALVPPAALAVLGAIAGLVAGGSINAVAAFGEEAGWRGYAPRALADAPFWPAALGTGALWGLWHAPLIVQGYNFPGAPVLGVLQMMLACAALTPPMLWLRGRAGSVLAAALFHGTLNGVAGLVTLFLIGGNAILAGPLGLGAVIVLSAVNLVLAFRVPLRARMRDVVA